MIAHTPAPRTPVEWLLDEDTANSCKTIIAVMTSSRIPSWASSRFPLDVADFGDCYRLFIDCPEWRARLQEVVAHFPAWGPLVANWAVLEADYEAFVNMEEGTWQRLCQRIRALGDEGHRISSGRAIGGFNG